MKIETKRKKKKKYYKSPAILSYFPGSTWVSRFIYYVTFFFIDRTAATPRFIANMVMSVVARNRSLVDT